MTEKVGFLEEGAGQRSSYRFVMVMYFSTLCVGWLYVAIATVSVPDIPYGVAGLATALLLGKNWQKRVERKLAGGSAG